MKSGTDPGRPPIQQSLDNLREPQNDTFIIFFPFIYDTDISFEFNFNFVSAIIKNKAFYQMI